MVQEIVASICNSGTVNEAVDLYHRFSPLLQNYRFVFATEKGARPGSAVNRNFCAGASVLSLFKTEGILVLDKHIVEEMATTGKSTFPIDFSISLDTQAVSYLEPYVEGKRTPKIPSDFKEVFDFIADDAVNVDPIPYLLENFSNFRRSSANADKIFCKLKAYEVLRTLDKHWLKTRDEARSTLSEDELCTRTQQLISTLYCSQDSNDVLKGLVFRHQFMYAYLLKMVSIHLNSPGATLEKKMAEFLDFSHLQLATMNGRETALARKYFDRGQKLRFFGRIQKNRPDLLETLQNMAWDLWHIRQMEETMTFSLSEEARLLVPAILTFDKGLIEVVSLYPLRAYAFEIGGSAPTTSYDGNWLDLISDEPANAQTILDKYFSGEARTLRESRRPEVKKKFASIIDRLEGELRGVGNVPN